MRAARINIIVVDFVVDVVVAVLYKKIAIGSHLTWFSSRMVSLRSHRAYAQTAQNPLPCAVMLQRIERFVGDGFLFVLARNAVRQRRTHTTVIRTRSC